MTGSEQEQSETHRYSKARRTYRILGLIHAPLFGAIVAKKPLQTGEYLIAATAFVVVALITMGVFWKLADDHYRGNVPGKPGGLVYKGDSDE